MPNVPFSNKTLYIYEAILLMFANKQKTPGTTEANHVISFAGI